MDAPASIAIPYMEDEDPSQIVIISLSKKGGCRFRLM
jgi:hypothetical protein